MTVRRILGGLAVLLLSASTGVARADNREKSDRACNVDELSKSIFGKLEYDKNYFERVLRRDQSGEPAQASEVARARLHLPVLERMLAARSDYEKGMDIRAAPGSAEHRTYNNLAAILNMLRACDRGDFAAMVAAGQKVELKGTGDLGLRIEGEASYQHALLREYYFLIALANYRLGLDDEALKWFARLGGDADLNRLKAMIGPDSTSTQRAEDFAREAKLEQLMLRPIGVMPFGNTSKKPELEWLSQGLALAISSDLARDTSLVVVERTLLDKVVQEVRLEHILKLTESSEVEKKLSTILDAGTVLLGSYEPHGDRQAISIRIVEVAGGRLLAAAQADVTPEHVLEDTREVMLKAFSDLRWIDAISAAELRTAKVPRAELLRGLLEAKLQRGSQAEQAKEVFAQAMKEDPALANLFQDLRNEFKDVSATVGVLPFQNVFSDPADAWMVGGISEALSSDLPKLRFNVVERSQIDRVVSTALAGGTLSPENAPVLGKSLGADFLVVGSFLHQKPRVRVDARFVDVKSGAIVAAISVEDRNDDFMAMLRELSRAIAEHFNAELGKETLAELAGAKMSAQDFEKYMRGRLRKETLSGSASVLAVDRTMLEENSKSTVPFWVAVSAATAGTLVAGGGLSISDRYSDNASYRRALGHVTIDSVERASLNDLSDADAGRARMWRAAAFSGLGLAVAGIGWLIWQEL